MRGLKNHILVPVDFSEQSIVALEQSYNLARLTMADITLINVIDESFQLPFFSKKDDKSLEKKIKKELERLSSETTQKLNIHIQMMMSTTTRSTGMPRMVPRDRCSRSRGHAGTAPLEATPVEVA